MPDHHKVCMKGTIFNQEQFDPIVYGDQTLFIKTFPSSLGKTILHMQQNELFPYTVNSRGEPLKRVTPHYKLHEQFYIKEDWRVISILNYNSYPSNNGRYAVLYADDLNTVKSSEMQNGINTFLFNNTLQADCSIPNLEMKASCLMLPPSMPSWAARFVLEITSVKFKHLKDVTLQEVVSATGCEQMTLDNFCNAWNAKVGHSQAWEQNPVIGIYSFEINTLNGYTPSVLNGL